MTRADVCDVIAVDRDRLAGEQLGSAKPSAPAAPSAPRDRPHRVLTRWDVANFETAAGLDPRAHRRIAERGSVGRQEHHLCARRWRSLRSQDDPADRRGRDESNGEIDAARLAAQPNRHP